MLVFIYHAKNTRDSFFYCKNGEIYNQQQALEAFKNDGYTSEGILNIPHEYDNKQSETELEHLLETAYIKSQNDTPSWRNREHKSRSTSVGDILQIEADLYIVSSFGFEKLPPVQRSTSERYRHRSPFKKRINMGKIRDIPSDGGTVI